MADPVSTLPVGIEVLAGEDIQRIAAFAHGEGYKFVVPPLLKLGSVPVHDVGRPLPASLNHANLVVNGPEYAQLSIGSISPWIDLESSDQTTVSNSQILVQQQIHWASHIGLPGVIFHCPPSGSVFSFARSVAEAAGMLSHTQVYVRVSLSDGQNDAWTRWNAIRMLARHNAKIAVALEINHELPGDDTLKKWLAEPVKMVIVPTNTFVANRKGFPVLRKRHQVFLQQLMQSERRYVIASADFESIHPSGTLASYREYLEHLHRTVPEPDTINRFADGYHE
nr:Protein arginine N-methyltransferase 5 [Polyrhizophydium stewartii]